MLPSNALYEVHAATYIQSRMTQIENTVPTALKAAESSSVANRVVAVVRTP